MVFGTVSHGESTRASREYGRAFPHTFIISRAHAHAHEYMASISVFTIPLEHARAYDVRTSVNLATASSVHPPVSGWKGRSGGWGVTLDLPTYPAFGIHADRSPLLTVDKPRESDCRPDSRACLDGCAYTCARNTHASVEYERWRAKRREEKRREEQHRWVGRSRGGRIRMPAARLANT